MELSDPQRRTHLQEPLRCIVKLGGAAITCKEKFETLNEQVLTSVSQQLKEALVKSTPALTMDWSNDSGTKAGFLDHIQNSELHVDKFIVIHGAGSFGHFQANNSGVHKGGLPSAPVAAGFVATRISVTSLNLNVVRTLAKEGIPAVGISPLALGWSTCNRNIDNANISDIVRILNASFIPVLHGDAVLDNEQGCTILSGDVIMRKIAQVLTPRYVVFLTDVAGVFDRPPKEMNATLLKEIVVHEDGTWSVTRPLLSDIRSTVQTDVAKHDTTGGMATKIEEAATIARLGIDVLIVQAGTDHCLKALKGEINAEALDDWVGTFVRYSPKVLT